MGKLRRFWSKNKLSVSLGIVVLVIALTLFGTKIYLYINFLLGNDIVVKLEANKEYLFLKRGESEVIEFKASVRTNPFCGAVCESTFRDINKNRVIESDSFNLKPSLSVKKEYMIKSREEGLGQDLYRFEMECLVKASKLCESSEEPTTRSIVISVDNGFNEGELKEREEFGIDLNSVYYEALKLEYLNEKWKGVFEILNKSWEINASFEEFNYSKGLRKISEECEVVNLDEIKLEIDKSKEKVGSLNESLRNFVELNNEVIKDLKRIRMELSKYENSSWTRESVIEIGIFVNLFNNGVKILENRGTLSEKKEVYDGILESFDNLTIKEGEETLIINLDEIDLEKIEFLEEELEFKELEFKEPKEECCVFGECRECCSDCVNENYPLILVHGHAINKDTSLDYSLEGFNQLQKELEKERYLSAGTITLYTKENVPFGVWGKSNVPVSLRVSYYFDLFKEPDNYVVVQTKSENIDTYAVRMKDLIENVKYRTGKSKVNIIAFSMGGLVTRRYAQVFGGEDINKLILIGVPNKGVVGDVAALCPLVGGEKRECEDMKSGSLFLNKLNRGKLDLEIYNIYGTGCSMVGGKGDGIVLEESAHLEGAYNYVINGKCRGKFDPMHLDLLDPEQYPEILKIIRGVLKKPMGLDQGE